MFLAYRTRNDDDFKSFPSEMMLYSWIEHVQDHQTLTFQDLVEKIKDLAQELSDNNTSRGGLMQAIMVYSFLAQHVSEHDDTDETIFIRYE